MTKWTPEMIATATGMKRAGFSSAKIAERLGVTTRAVSSMTTRKGCYASLTRQRGHSALNMHKGSLSNPYHKDDLL